MTKAIAGRLAAWLNANCELRIFLPILAAACSLSFFLIRTKRGIWFRSWGDELEHLLGGWTLSHGDRNYVDFVDLHGPFIFFLAKTHSELFGWSQGNYIRIVPIAFLLFASFAIASSSSLSGIQQRSWAITLFLGLVATVWIVQGLYLFEYYLVSGALLTIVLAWYAVPSWRGASISWRAAALSGVSATLAVFTSHAWLPTVASLFVSTLQRSNSKTNAREVETAFF